MLNTDHTELYASCCLERRGELGECTGCLCSGEHAFCNCQIDAWIWLWYFFRMSCSSIKRTCQLRHSTRPQDLGFDLGSRLLRPASSCASCVDRLVTSAKKAKNSRQWSSKGRPCATCTTYSEFILQMPMHGRPEDTGIRFGILVALVSETGRIRTAILERHRPVL